MTLVNIVSISYPNRATIASMMIAAMTAPKPAACFLCFDSAKNSGAGGGVTSLQSAAHASRASADVRAEAS